jgi:type IV pilus assembly protein PilW
MTRPTTARRWRLPAGPGTPHDPDHRRSGFALVELMIALALGLVVIAALGQLYAGGKQSYVLSDAMARLDETARFTVDFIATDLRMAGYLSCGGSQASIGNSIRNDSSITHNWLFQTQGIQGYEGGVGTPPADFTGQYRTGTDILIVRRATLDLERSLIMDDATNGVMKLGLNHRFQIGEVLAISNPSCTQVSVFQVTQVLNLDHPQQTTAFDAIAYGIATGLNPGNCTRLLFGAFDCSNNSTNATSGVFLPGSVVSRFATHAYYVSATDPPTLMRKRLGVMNGQATVITEELIRHVESFQVRYGRDTVKDNNHRVDDYVTANQVTDWTAVVAVRFALLISSAEENVRAQASSTTYDLLGVTVSAPADRRLRRSLGSVVALRNNVP